jgi:hypothetical protein
MKVETVEPKNCAVCKAAAVWPSDPQRAISWGIVTGQALTESSRLCVCWRCGDKMERAIALHNEVLTAPIADLTRDEQLLRLLDEIIGEQDEIEIASSSGIVAFHVSRLPKKER